MIRLFLAPAMLGLVVLGCSRDRTRETAANRDTSAAPVGAVAASDTSRTAPVGADSMSAPSPQVAKAPAPDTPAPATPAPPAPATPAPPAPAKPDTPPGKPNIHPQAVGEPPVVPRAAAGAQDTAKAQPRDPYHQAPRDTVSPAVYNGWKQVNLNCARCHGEDVLGTTIAPHLIQSLKPDGPINTKELFIQTVCNGRPKKGMPAWCTIGLDTAKIEQIYAYVKGRSDGKVGPGRPAVRE